MSVTKEQVKAGIEVIRSVGDAIRDLGRVPSGELYARLMGYLTMQDFNNILDVLKGAGLIKIIHHEIVWVGGQKCSQSK